MAHGKVIEGEYKSSYIQVSGGKLKIISGFFSSVSLTSETIKAYNIIMEDNSKKMGSVIGRGAVGFLLLGPLGALAGGVTAKTKGYTIEVEFMDGKSSIIQIPNDLYIKLFPELKKVDERSNNKN